MDDASTGKRPEVYLPRPSRALLRRARELRREQTPAERCLWEVLRDRRLEDRKFRRQHAIGTFITDFFCDDALLVIEVDGAVHLESTQQQRDRDRDEAIRVFGLAVLRFTNDEVLRDTARVRDAIAEYVRTHSVQRGLP